MTVIGAIKRVMRARGQPLSVSEICNEIIASGYYTFRTPHPTNIVGHALRRHCIDIDLAASGRKRWFRLVDNDKYALLGAGKRASISVHGEAGNPDETKGNARHHPTIKETILAVMSNAGKALSANEVYQRIVKRNLYEFHAQQPGNVVKGLIRRHCKDLDFPTAKPTKFFGMTRDGKFYRLDVPLVARMGQSRGSPRRAAQKPTINSTLRQLRELGRLHRELTKERILQDVKKVSPAAFERFARRLLEVYGFERMQVTAVTRDGGIDGFGKLRVGLAFMGVAFQCKRWIRANVGRPEVDKFRGAIQGEYEQGILFTTAHFSAGAKQVSFKRGAVPIILIDGPGIVDLMIEKGFGVEQEALHVYTYALDTIVSGDEEGGQGSSSRP
jgi:restriction system protein